MTDEKSALLVNDDEGRRSLDLKGAARWWDFVKEFVILSFVSFGGPQSHIAVLRHDVVETRKWFSPHRFAEMFSLCSALPGPSSSQLVTAAGLARMGAVGGIAAYLLFLWPGFAVMLTLGSLAGMYTIDQFYLVAIETGLSLAGLTLIGVNAISLGTTPCKHTFTRIVVCVIVSLWFSSHWWIFPSLFAASAIATFVFFTLRPAQLVTDASADNEMALPPLGYGRGVGAVVLGFSLSVLVVLIVLSSVYPSNKNLALAETFYRIGATIFGGGNVMLAEFQSELVQGGLISGRQFFLGFALVSALPGPVFNFALYLGAVIGGPLVGVMCWLCLNFPGISLVYALFPYWLSLKSALWVRLVCACRLRDTDAAQYRKLNAGLNACGVGLIIQAYITIFFAIVNVSVYRVVLHVLTWAAWLTLDLKPHFIILLGGATGGLYGTSLHYMNITL